MSIELLHKALTNLAGTPHEGDLVFTRALTPSEIREALGSPSDSNQGWQMVGVGAHDEEGWITADRAVELREDKGQPTILLVDPRSAGAGMDGVYSAAREISENQVFREAIVLAKKQLKPEARAFADLAMRYARMRGGRRRTLAVRQELQLVKMLLENPEAPGRAVTAVGLWPIAGDFDESSNKLPYTSALVERLLLPPSTSQPADVRVDGLRLEIADQDVCGRLSHLLRDAAGRRLDTVLEEVAADERLWLGNLRPGFLGKELTSIELLDWRRPNNTLFAWSGLKHIGDDALPQFIVDPSSAKCKLEVHWQVQPSTLPKGSARFEVKVLAGEEVLASQEVDLRAGGEQKAVFTPADFEEIDESGRWEVRIEVSAPSTVAEPQYTEDFLLLYGEAPLNETVSAGDLVRCAAEGFILADSLDEVEELAKDRARGVVGLPDKKGHLAFRLRGSRKGFRIERPKLLAEIEAKWLAQGNPLGRWVVHSRPDGTLMSSPNYVPLVADEGASSPWLSKLVDACKALHRDLRDTGGILSRVFIHGGTGAAVLADYLNAWKDALENGPPELALANTLEVQTAAGKTVGIIVLPFHPIRAAWQAGYDNLALQLRYTEQRSALQTRKAVQHLDGAHYPFALPGLKTDEKFVFGDCLGLAGVAMISDADPEPKASVALLSACYAGDSEKLAPILSGASGSALAKEVRAYLNTHSDCSLLKVHALKPGDGATVVRALYEALRLPDSETNESADHQELRPVSVRLDLYPSNSHPMVCGRHLTKLNQRRRAGSGALADADAWCLDSLDLGHGRWVPRLRWAKREARIPEEPGHLAIAFDAFSSRVVAEESDEAPQPLIAFGLVANVQRRFSFEEDEPVWRTTVAAQHEGEKLAARAVTERLLNLQTALMSSVSRQLRRTSGWPWLQTRLNANDRELLDQLHDRCDWVVTMDRNVGIEYFDSPWDLEPVFNGYVIDAVPERDDLGCLQLITSTTHFDEVRGLLDDTLQKMGLSGSAKNCRFLLNQLKALSGHLAMRLANSSRRTDGCTTGSELVALAMARHKSLTSKADADWPTLHQGFFVPLDDVQDLLGNANRKEETDVETSKGRADLLHVSLRSRDRLAFRFVEVKYRRHLSMSRDTHLRQTIVEQLADSRRAWADWFFGPRITELEQTLRFAQLSRVLRFYADKAGRHHLSSEVHRRIQTALARLLLTPSDPKIDDSVSTDFGLVFCPEFKGSKPEVLEVQSPDNAQVLLFGPDTLPDQIDPTFDNISYAEADLEAPATTEPHLPELADVTQEGKAVETDEGDPKVEGADEPQARTSSSPDDRLPEDAPIQVTLGYMHSDSPVSWSPSIRGNPHLMIVGLPGMGKTTALINICRQLESVGITPIVFSYHDDLDEALARAMPQVAMHDCFSLGFNPMRIVEPKALAHVDAAGQLRDIFAAIFPELGEIQLAKLRGAFLKSYEHLGWGLEGSHVEPRFAAFLDHLRHEVEGSRDSGVNRLLERLKELEDYRFFDENPGEDSSLLDGRAPRLIRIHSVASEMMQQAHASFALYRIYQDMFRRGRQDFLTHAIVFDEAHKASRLKLLPKMAKECRKFGLSLIVASQEAKDFDDGLFAAVANYLVLRVTDADAKAMARNVSATNQERVIIDKLKALPKYEAYFFAEERRSPTHLTLQSPTLNR